MRFRIMSRQWLGVILLMSVISGCNHETGDKYDGIIVHHYDGSHVLITEYAADKSQAPKIYRVRTGKSPQLDIGQKVLVSLRPEVNTSFPPGATASSVNIDYQFEKYVPALSLAIRLAKTLTSHPVYIEDVIMNGEKCVVKIGEIISHSEYRHLFDAEIDLHSNTFIKRP